MRRRGLLRKSRDVGARYGRMTIEDVVQLGAVFMQVAKRQAGDSLIALRRQLEPGRRVPGRGRRGSDRPEG